MFLDLCCHPLPQQSQAYVRMCPRCVILAPEFEAYVCVKHSSEERCMYLQGAGLH